MANDEHENENAPSTARAGTAALAGVAGAPEGPKQTRRGFVRTIAGAAVLVTPVFATLSACDDERSLVGNDAGPDDAGNTTPLPDAALPTPSGTPEPSADPTPTPGVSVEPPPTPSAGPPTPAPSASAFPLPTPTPTPAPSLPAFSLPPTSFPPFSFPSFSF